MLQWDALGWCSLSLPSPLCASPEIEAKYNKKMQMLRDELDLRRKTEIHEVEERKNNQISELMKNHEKAFSEIKNYYNDITLKNLALINLLKVLPACCRSPGLWWGWSCKDFTQTWPAPWWRCWCCCSPAHR